MSTAEDPHPRGSLPVKGVQMTYAEAGEGPPIWLLHGNPTCSYIWRNIIPHLTGLGHCIAPDLVGMGGSDKLADSGPERYRYAEHRSYLFGLFDALGETEDVILVLHDWGAALGFDWARNHPGAVRGIAYMEPMLMPLTWDLFPPPAVDPFKAMRGPQGEEMCLEQNFFVEQVIPMAVMRDLSPEEMDAYRKPYPEPGEGRRATLTWPREIPVEGQPDDVAAVLEANCDWLASSDIPKLFISADPGMMVTGQVAERCRTFPNQTEVVVKGAHYIQEDSPDEIGKALASWIRERVVKED